MISFLYKYVFRGIGTVLLASVLTVLWMACAGCTGPIPREDREAKAKAMRQVTGGGSEAIRDYARGKARAK
jgi:hypothetical protein